MITSELLGERYLAVHHRMFRAVNDEMNGCGLSMARTKVLRRLHEQGPARQSVLAADFELSPHSITDIVDGLERHGLAERRPDPADRRSRLVVATDEGRATWGRLQDELRRVEAHVLSPLPAADAASFQALLSRLACRAQSLDPLANLCEVAQQVKGDSAEPSRVAG